MSSLKQLWQSEKPVGVMHDRYVGMRARRGWPSGCHPPFGTGRASCRTVRMVNDVLTAVLAFTANIRQGLRAEKNASQALSLINNLAQ